MAQPALFIGKKLAVAKEVAEQRLDNYSLSQLLSSNGPVFQSNILPSIGRKLWPTVPATIFALGAALIAGPTMYDVARLTWTTEQGGHAPIILATGAWLLIRDWRASRPAVTRPPLLAGALLLALFLLIYFFARVSGILEIEAAAMYLSLVAGAYLIAGFSFLKTLWFPILYLALAMPPPDSVVALVTQPIKIQISSLAVNLLHDLNYPIANNGVMIQIANFELLVAAACAGLNSIISLSAICLFYVYLQHRNDWLAFFIVAMAIVPVAIFSNFARVIILILITYHFGESAAQGFLHDFAGIFMFAVAVITIFGIDSVFSRLRAMRVPS